MSAEITFIEVEGACNDAGQHTPRRAYQNHSKDFYAVSDGVIRVDAIDEAVALTFDGVTTTVPQGGIDYFGVKGGTWVLVSLGEEPYQYFAANGSGAGASIDDPMLWSQANLDAALLAGKIVRLVGPAATPEADDAKRSDEFAENSGGWSINTANAIIEGIAHPSNPGGTASFCGTRMAWEKPSSETPTDVTTWLEPDGVTINVGGLGFVPKASGITIRNIHFRRIGTAIKMSQAGADNLLVENCTAYNLQRFLDQPINIRATATVTFASNPSNGDTLSVNGNVITFVTAVSNAAVQILIGANASATATNFQTYVNLYYKLLSVRATTVSSGVIRLTSNLLGSDGNGSAALTKSSSAITLSGASLSGGSTITNNDGIVRNIGVTGYSKALMRNSGNSSGWLFQNIVADSGWQAGDSFARLWNANDAAHDIEIEDCTASNIYDSDSTYWNGDGFECNDGNRNITFTRCRTIGATDGGFDTKGINIIKVDCSAGSCKRLDRNWGEVASLDSTYTTPHNRGTTSGELGNGSAFVFVNGYFDTTVTGTDPWDGAGASRFRGNILHENCTYIGDGDAASGSRLTSLFLLIGGAGGVARFVNCTRNSPTTTAGLDAPLTLANAGPVTVATGGKAIFFNGDKASIGCVIKTDLTQSAKEGSSAAITLEASLDGSTVYQDCTWELDRSNPDVINGSITLSSWASHNPSVTFVAPSYPGSVEVDVTVIDAAGNRITDTLVVTSTAILPTDPPLYSGAGPLTAVATVSATSVSPALPSGVASNDIILLVAHTNKTLTDPTVSGYTHLRSQSQNPSTSNIRSHLFWKRAGSSESAPTVIFDTGIASTTADIHAAQTFLIRNARTSGDPFEGDAAAASTTSNTSKTAPSVTTSDGNRLVLNLFVPNNDCTGIGLSGGTFVEASEAITTIGSDLTVYVSAAESGASAATVSGSTMTWTSSNTTSQNFGLAFLPKVDP